MHLRAKLSILAALLAFCAGCDDVRDDPVMPLAFIGDTQALNERGVRLSAVGQHLRAATHEGLVGLDERGEVIPAIAERWIVTDDGKSYIFRLRDSQWPDGETITARQVRDQLRRAIDRLADTSLGLDLTKIVEIRAMTGRVVEIRLLGPMPDFLHLLAQPELGLERSGSGTGPMMIGAEDEDGDGDGKSGEVLLQPIAPSRRGLPEPDNWPDTLRELRVSVLPAEAAVRAFEQGQIDLVMNGSLANLALADTGALSRGTVRIDATLGLLGLEFTGQDGFFATPENREAVAMAVDRALLLQPFNIGGWVPTTRIVPPEIATYDVRAERWADLTIEQRRAVAAGRVSAWEGKEGEDLVLEIFLPPGAGSDLLFTGIARGLAEAGIGSRRADRPAMADLVLKDRPARYADARWFLNQFNCTIVRGPCSEEADELVRQSMSVADPAERGRLLAEAERIMLDANIYVPFGAPVRWSLVRSGVTGYEPNRWSIHPLFPLAQRPM